MRKLTQQEEKAMQQARTELLDEAKDLDIQSVTLISAAYRQAWKDCLDYQQRKLDAYAAYVSGKITMKELEEVLK